LNGEVWHRHTDVRLLEAMYSGGGEGPFASTRDAHAAMFAVQHSLAKLAIHEWGVEPAAVMGYSNGEMAAAVTAGMLTLEQACVVFRHTEYREFVTGVGGMAVVGDVSWETLHQVIGEVREPLLVVSAVYSDSAFMLSGPLAAVEAAAAVLQRRGVLNVTQLDTPYAAHSFLHRVVLTSPPSVRLRAPLVPFASCAVGGWVRSARAAAHVLDASVAFEQPVRFKLAMDALQAAGVDILLDIRCALYTSLGDGMRVEAESAARDSIVVGTLRRYHAKLSGVCG
jgi:acyl transferase domain-containing protein